MPRRPPKVIRPVDPRAEAALDAALTASFPASHPIAVLVRAAKWAPVPSRGPRGSARRSLSIPIPEEGHPAVTYSSIMTLVDGSQAAVQRARVAATLAARFDARLTGTFPQPPLPLSAWDEPVYWGMPPVIPPAVPPEILAAHTRRTEAQGEEARLAFEATAAAAGCRSEWLVLASDMGEGVVELTRRTDLTVLPPGRLPTVGHAGAAPVDLVLASGGPALILPDRVADPAPGRRVVVAWNGSREAARAVRDAWPFLSTAESIHVVVVAPGEAEGPDSLLQRYFEDHGCTAEVVVVREADAGAADILRRQAEALKADLIVMGLYGHSRLRETVLGGVSHDLLRDPPVALLVSH